MIEAFIQSLLWLSIGGLLLSPLALFMPVFATTGSFCGGTCTTDPPVGIQVTLSGISNADCATCNTLNGTYTATNAWSTSGTSCTTVVPGVLVQCAAGGFDSLGIGFVTSGGDTLLQVALTVDGTGLGTTTFIVWQKNLGTTAQACSGLGTVSVPYLSTTGLGATFRCDGSGSTCTLVFP